MSKNFCLYPQNYLRFNHVSPSPQIPALSFLNQSDLLRTSIISYLHRIHVCWLINRADSKLNFELICELNAKGRLSFCAKWHQFSSVQSLSRVWLFATPWTAARQAPLSITNSRSLLRLMSIESVMPSNHLILCHSLLLPPSIFPSIRVFSNESALHMRWSSHCEVCLFTFVIMSFDIQKVFNFDEVQLIFSFIACTLFFFFGILCFIISRKVKMQLKCKKICAMYRECKSWQNSTFKKWRS